MEIGPLDFVPFNKLSRLSRNCVITEKIDGTNAQIVIGEAGEFLVGSRTRYITPGKSTDNSGFAAWAHENKESLLALGPGRHYGEWWGKGIQRTYGLDHRRFSLFNTGRWTSQNAPACCHIVPVVYEGLFTTDAVDNAMAFLKGNGSIAAPGFHNPEGVVVFHAASGRMFKKTMEHDDVPKSSLEVK